MTITTKAVPSEKALPSLTHIYTKPLVQELKILLESSQNALNELTSTYTSRLPSESIDWDIIPQLESIEDKVAKFLAPIRQLCAVSETSKLRTDYQICLDLATRWYAELAQNTRLHQIINHIANHPNFSQLNTTQQRLIHNKQREFKLAGAYLTPDKQQRYKTLQAELAQDHIQFENNILDASGQNTFLIDDKNQLKGLPEPVIQVAVQQAAQQHKKGWLFTLNGPTYQSILTTADNRNLREIFYKAWITRASDQMPERSTTTGFDNSALIFSILNKRYELSQISGFQNYAERSLATDKMAKSTQEVMDFLSQLLNMVRPSALKDLQDLQAFAAQEGFSEPLQDWDLAYFSEKLRAKQFGIQDEALRAYFPSSRVLSGLIELLHRLFKIHIKIVSKTEVWHPSVQILEIHDSQNHLRGYIYLDLYAREHKREGAWVDDCERRRLRQDNILQLPVCFLNCNFRTPTPDAPALLTHNDVITLFHEMGHALHHVLTQVDYADLAGTQGVPWDAVEFPSQFLENFAWEAEVLNLISCHYKTYENLPAHHIDALRASRNFQAGLQLIRQLEFSLFDFQLHLEFKPEKGPEQIQVLLDAIRTQTRVLPTASFNRFQNSFSHIFADDYAAGYYSYLWAEVLAADAFSRFIEDGIFNAQAGHEFMSTILETGGSADILELFQKFRGRLPEIKAFLSQRGITSIVS
jgi:oligopeptidase A